jgi:hypothetical protein
VYSAEAHEKEKVEQLHFSFKDEDSLLAKLRGAARKFAIDSASFMEPLQVCNKISLIF